MKRIIRRSLMVLALPCVLAGSLLFADTLTLKSGETIVGTFSSGNQNEIVFNANGRMRRFNARDVRAIEFAPDTTWNNQRQSNAPWSGGAWPNASGAPRRWRTVDNSWIHFAYPANWRVSEESADVIHISGSGRGFNPGSGNEATVRVGMHRQWGSSTQGLRGPSLEGETNNILADLGGQMRNVRRSGPSQPFQLDGQRALRTPFTSGDYHDQDQNWLITSMHPQGVLYIVFSGPAEDFQDLEGLFQQMQDTFRMVR